MQSLSNFIMIDILYSIIFCFIKYRLLISIHSMVRIKTITQDPQSSVVRCPTTQHPFSRARQFQRAYNAVRLQKIFAKPFLGTLQGHSDGVSVLAKCPKHVNRIISGSQDGQIKVWDLSSRTCLTSVFQHSNAVKGVSFSRDGSKFVSSSQQAIYLYDFKQMFEKTKKEPLTKYLSKSIIGNVDHCWQNNQFATSGEIVQIWSYERTRPIYKFQWNVDSILKVKYNPAEPNILCGTASDRSIILYDIRGQSAIQKIYLGNKSSCLSFNPIQPINLTVGNDDSNSYTFDVRKMDKARTIHKDHIGPITDLDYSSTGQQFVTGSFDKTIRLFNHTQGRSNQVYHSKRMQIVNCVLYSMDSNYVFSGSEDMNIRIWKSKASMPTGNVSAREKRALQYRQALIKKYQHSNKIRRISRYRHLPKYILNSKKRKEDQNQSTFRKRINREANTGIKEDKIPDKQKIIDKVEIEDQQVYHKRKRLESDEMR